MKRTLAALLCVLLLFSLLAGCGKQKPDPEASGPEQSSSQEESEASQPEEVAKALLANLHSFTGEVEVETDGETAEGYEGMRLYAGDTLRTGKDSTANLDLDQGRLVMMDAETELELREAQDGGIEVYLTGGTILNDIAKGQEQTYSVHAANTTMGVLGTVFLIHIDDVTGVPTTELYEGNVVVTFTNSVGDEFTLELESGRRFTATEQNCDGSAEQEELVTDEVYPDDLSDALLASLEEALRAREDAEYNEIIRETIERIDAIQLERARPQQQQQDGVAPAPQPDPPAPTPPSAPVDATVSPASARFDTYVSASGYADKTFTLAPGSYALNGIKLDKRALADRTDYTASGNTYTIKKATLGVLTPGRHTITFDMNGGADPTVTLTVTDGTPTALTIDYLDAEFLGMRYNNPLHVNFDLSYSLTVNDADDVSVSFSSSTGNVIFPVEYGAYPTQGAGGKLAFRTDGNQFNPVWNIATETETTVTMTVRYVLAGVRGVQTATATVDLECSTLIPAAYTNFNTTAVISCSRNSLTGKFGYYMLMLGNGTYPYVVQSGSLTIDGITYDQLDIGFFEGSYDPVLYVTTPEVMLEELAGGSPAPSYSFTYERVHVSYSHPNTARLAGETSEAILDTMSGTGDLGSLDP